MCGRYTLGLTKKSLEERYDADLQDQLVIPRYNVAPTQAVPTITMHNPGKISVFNWGLIPHWAKDAKVASKMINARSETIDTKPAFKQAFQSRRCLIPVTGFYEWKNLGGKKIPYYIWHKLPILSLAGLYEHWVSPEGKTINTCTIITTEVNQKLAPLHHRMPVMLLPHQETTWLSKDSQPNDLQELLAPAPDQDITFHPVSTLVNRVAIDHAKLIEKFDHGDTYIQKSLFD